MNIQQDQSNSKKQATLCKECALFYGNSAFNDLCSTCHKKSSEDSKIKTIQKSPAVNLTPTSIVTKDLINHKQELTVLSSKLQQKDKKRCFDCNKKIGLLGNECKCGYLFCNSHRLPQNHKCQFDYKQSGIDRLKKEVLKVQNGKITEI